MRSARWRMFVGCVVCVACGGDDAPTPDAGSECARACDDGLYCNGAERCDPSAESADEAGCVRGAPPCGESACDDVADACDVDCAIPDADGDGDPALACGGGDCNDADPRVASTRTEVCDEENLDEDCDPGTVGGRDSDGDGVVDARCCNGSACGNDCDDARPNVNPTTAEVCDGFDNDCDGSVDEGVLVTFYRDADGDDFGTPSESRVGCTAPEGFARTSTDCDDTNAGRNPGLAEVCDAIPDNDCNPTTNPFDADGDGHDRVSCGGTDCDDTDDTVYLGAPELCDRRDNACNFGGGVLASEDADGDGHAPIGAACTGGLPKDDCDDSRAESFLGAEEVCSGRDEDCDGSIDEDPAAMASCNRTGTVGACVSGACTIAACMSPYANCNGIANDGCEANLDTSTSHCGGCDNACAAGASCVGRSCRCPVGMVVCDDACVDLQTDARHCGGCGDACPFGATCEASTCRCPFGWILCGGECVDPNSDVRHCGGCGATCFGGSCAGGACECPGAVGTLCGGECFDLSVDLDHCGACDEGCRGGSCAGGACSCPPGRPTVCEGTCTDTLTNPLRCGTCDHQCIQGAGCGEGECRPRAVSQRQVAPYGRPLVTADGAGRVFVAGAFTGTMTLGGRTLTSSGGLDVYLATFDSVGTVLDLQRIGGGGDDQPNILTSSASGDLLFGVHTNSTSIELAGESFLGLPGVAMVVLDASSNVVGSRSIASLYSLSSMNATAVDGGFVIAFDVLHTEAELNLGGAPLTSRGTAGGQVDFAVASFDRTLAHRWSNRWGSLGSDPLRAAAADNDSVYLAFEVSRTAEIGAPTTVAAGTWLARYELATGAWVWTVPHDYVDCIVSDGSGTLWSAGFPGIRRRSAATGAVLSERNLSDFGSPRFACALDDSRRFYVAGWTGSAHDFGGGALTDRDGGNADFVMASYEPSGAFRWAAHVDARGNERGLDVAIDSTGAIWTYVSFDSEIDVGLGPLESRFSRPQEDGVLLRFVQ